MTLTRRLDKARCTRSNHTATTAWIVRKTDVISLVMFYAPYDGSHRIYVALH